MGEFIYKAILTAEEDVKEGQIIRYNFNLFNQRDMYVEMLR